MENDCKRFSRGSCIDGGNIDKCIGKDCCGAYEPSCSGKPNNSIPSKCWQCLNFTGSYCEIHLHLIEDCEDCTTEQSDFDMRISVEHLREILNKCVEVGYINEYAKHRIIELVKKEI